MAIDVESLVIDALLELVEAEGIPLERVTVKRILERSGVSRQTFYNHFLDKNDLICQTYERRMVRAYQGDIDNWDAVDTVYLGYPIWWMDLPQIVKTFVAAHDWNGKTVIPFCSYYSSGWSGTPETLAETCTGATLVDGIALAQGSLPGGLDDIDAWHSALQST